MGSEQSRSTKSITGRADEKLVRVLEETATHKVLEKLEGPLQKIVHEAVREAIVHATHADGVSMPRVRGESRSFAPAAEAVEPRKPKEGGVCEAVWKELDKLHAKGTVPTLAAIQKVSERKRWNPNNTRVEYYQWRKDKGITGRQAAPKKQASQPAQAQA